MASHLTITPDSSDISFHAWPASASLALFPLPSTVSSATSIKNILIVSSRLLHHRPANAHGNPPTPHPPSPMLNFHPVFILDPPLPSVLPHLTRPHPESSACNAIAPMIPAFQPPPPPPFSFPSLLNMFMTLQGVMGSWFWSDFSLMKTLGGSACPLLPLVFLVQVAMRVCIPECVLSVSLCTRSRFCCFVKKTAPCR